MEPLISEKRWDKAMEEDIIKEWLKNKIYEIKEEKGKFYSIDTPPPYVNAPIHAGHAYTFVQMDIMARYNRMKGHNVLFPLGLDTNGLPIEIQAEKKYKIDIHKTPRAEFIKKCEEMLNEAGEISSESFKRLGISFNTYEKTGKTGSKYLTGDPEYRRITQKTFKKMWDEGLVYEDLKPTNYCPKCRITIANSEIEYEEAKEHVAYGEDLIEDYFRSIAKIVANHHERHDGKGYPRGLKGKDIPLASRIIAVSDCFDAMTTKRAYNSPKRKEEAIKELKRCSGTQFDPKVVDAFVEVIREMT